MEILNVPEKISLLFLEPLRKRSHQRPVLLVPSDCQGSKASVCTRITWMHLCLWFLFRRRRGDGRDLKVPRNRRRQPCAARPCRPARRSSIRSKRGTSCRLRVSAAVHAAESTARHKYQIEPPHPTKKRPAIRRAVCISGVGNAKPGFSKSCATATRFNAISHPRFGSRKATTRLFSRRPHCPSSSSRPACQAPPWSA
jgi:hypothetical protein